MPNWVELDCVCGQFRALYGAEARWFLHWAHDCDGVAPWIRAWAKRRVDGPGPAVVQPQLTLPKEAP